MIVDRKRVQCLPRVRTEDTRVPAGPRTAGEVGAVFGQNDGLIIRNCRVNRHLVDTGSRSATVSAFYSRRLAC